MQVRVGGLLFEDWPVNFDRCYLISPKGLKGWLGGLTYRREEITRPTARGAFDAEAYLPQRVVSLSGTILAPTPQELLHMRNALTGVLARGLTGRMVVTDDGVSTWRDVQVAVQANITDGDEVSADFDISFWAPDPLAYGETRTFGSGEAAHHFGNTDAFPVVTIPGPRSGWTVTSSNGGTAVCIQALTSGETHTYYPETGLLLKNGVTQVRQMSVAGSWVIPPGVTVTHALPAGQVAVTDTFE